MHVEAIFRYVDADEDGALFVHNPTLQMRARARAAVRVWDCGGGDRTKLCLGLSSPRRTRAGVHLSASPGSFRRATQTYKAVRRNTFSERKSSCCPPSACRCLRLPIGL